MAIHAFDYLSIFFYTQIIFFFFKDDETIPDGEYELPADVDFGMACDGDSAEEFRHVDYFEELKDGLQCPVCFGPAWTFCQMKNSEKNGCYYCANVAIHEDDRTVKVIKK
jgi:hypothetical protein